MFATVYTKTNSKFHKFLTTPRIVAMSQYIQKLDVYICTTFDLRVLKKPRSLIREMEALDPAGNRFSSTNAWIQPLRRWRVTLGDRIKDDFTRFMKFFMKDVRLLQSLIFFVL